MGDRLKHEKLDAMEGGLLGLMVGETADRAYHSRALTAPGRRVSTDPVWGQSTSLTLATMAALLRRSCQVDYPQIMVQFLAWLQGTDYRASGQGSVDPSINTKYSILRFQNGIAPLVCGAASELSNCSDALARMLPIAYHIYRKAPGSRDRVDLVNNMSSLTNGHEISWLGCLIFSDYAGLLLDGVEKADAVRRLREQPYLTYYTQESLDEYYPILSGEILSRDRGHIRAAGYVPTMLGACIWSVLNTDNYRDAVNTAISLTPSPKYISDAPDVHGYAGTVTGALAGTLYGRKAIPREWLQETPDLSRLEDAVRQFVHALENTEPGS